jgi:anti-sigma28 factor (negative regulator of flagellin synthesis)
MNELSLNSSSGKSLPSSRVDKKNTAAKAQKSAVAPSESFKKVLKHVVLKSEGTPEIRRDLVEQYKATLARGTYEIKARELAEKMVQKIRENKTRTII